MTQIDSLPVLAVSIAFNPTNPNSTTQTWTDVSSYVQDFTTRSGRQHFLDRIEASSLNMTLDNRTGYFLNGTTNGTGYVIRTRLPVKVTATWLGTTYAIYFGLIESAEERLTDFLNQEIALTCADLTKQLSLTDMNLPAFWTNYAKSASAISWYRCDNTSLLPDLIGSRNINIVGAVQTTTGTLLYDSNTAIDLTNGGSTTNAAYINASFPTGSPVAYSIDFWLIGQNIAACPEFFVASNGTQYFTLQTDIFGRVVCNGPGAATATASNPINDGYWHHVGIYAGALSGSNYPYYLWVDGVSYSLGNIPASSTGWQVFNLGSVISATPLQAYVDEIIVSGASSTMATELAQRWTAGAMLKRTITSGDRIAEVLVLAGFGTLTAGALVPTNYTVNDSSWTSGVGSCFVQGFQTSVTGSTALSLIQQVTDTDIGAFFQTPAGIFEFDTQGYLYTAAQNALPTGTTIWTDATATGTSTYYDAISSQIVRDDADVWPVVRITPQNGVDQVATTTSSITSYGYGTLTKSGTVHQTNEAALQTAYYLASLYQTPLPRVQAVQLQSETNDGYLMPEMLLRYINDSILFIRNQNGASSAGQLSLRMSVENLQHEFKADPGYWHTTFMLDPYPKRFINQATPTYYLLFDDTTYGKLDNMILI